MRAAVEHQQHAHRREYVEAAEIAESCRAEAAKITILVGDLEQTITANDEELVRLGAEQSEHEASLSQTERELSSVLQPEVKKASRALRESEARRAHELQAAELLRRAGKIAVQLAEAKATAVPSRAEGSTEGASAAGRGGVHNPGRDVAEVLAFPGCGPSDMERERRRHRDLRPTSRELREGEAGDHAGGVQPRAAPGARRRGSAVAGGRVDRLAAGRLPGAGRRRGGIPSGGKGPLLRRRGEGLHRLTGRDLRER